MAEYDEPRLGTGRKRGSLGGAVRRALNRPNATISQRRGGVKLYGESRKRRGTGYGLEDAAKRGWVPSDFFWVPSLTWGVSRLPRSERRRIAVATKRRYNSKRFAASTNEEATNPRTTKRLHPTQRSASTTRIDAARPVFHVKRFVPSRAAAVPPCYPQRTRATRKLRGSYAQCARTTRAVS